MYKIAIAEDSVSIMNHLIQIVEGSGLGLHLAGTAYNGEEALELLQALRPDILVTDIRMPVVDGLSLIRHAKRLNPAIKSVIISGYDEFEYAREAMRLQTDEYMLKPVDPDDLIQALRSMIRRLDGERAQRLAACISGMLQNRTPPDPADSSSFPCRFCAALLRNEPIRPIAHSVFNDIDPNLQKDCRLAYQGWYRGKCLVLIEHRDGEDPARVFRTPFESLEKESVVAQGVFAAEPIELPELLHTLARLEQELDQALAFGRSRLASCSSSSTEALGSAGFSAAASDPAERFAEEERWERSLFVWIPALPKEKAAEAISQAIEKWEERSFSSAVILRMSGTFIRFLHRLAAEQGKTSPFHPEDLAAEWKEHALSYPTLKRLMIERIEEWYAGERTLNTQSAEDWFRSLESFLQANVFQQITVQDIASRFQVSSSYLHRIFKKYAGTSPMEYLTTLKMEEAKRILSRDHAVPIKKLADSLGFNDQHYFSKVFKSYVGCNPSEFRSAGQSPSGN